MGGGGGATGIGGRGPLNTRNHFLFSHSHSSVPKLSHFIIYLFMPFPYRPMPCQTLITKCLKNVNVILR